MIPTDIQNRDLAGWRFVTVYEVHEPCDHGSCCKVVGYYENYATALLVAKRLFKVERRAINAVTTRWLLTDDSKTGYLVSIGVDVFRRHKIRYQEDDRLRTVNA